MIDIYSILGELLHCGDITPDEYEEAMSDETYAINFIKDFVI